MAVTSQTVANKFIDLARNDGKQLDPMQILKLVYLAHGWTLGYTGEPLIEDKIEAWMYGPVVPALYEAVKGSRGAPIPDFLPAPVESPTAEQQDIIKRVYNTYKELNGIQLSNLTHQPDTPWDKIYNKGAGDWAEIPNSVIQDFYKKRVDAGKAGA